MDTEKGLEKGEVISFRFPKNLLRNLGGFKDSYQKSLGYGIHSRAIEAELLKEPRFRCYSQSNF